MYAIQPCGTTYELILEDDGEIGCDIAKRAKIVPHLFSIYDKDGWKLSAKGNLGARNTQLIIANNDGEYFDSASATFLRLSIVDEKLKIDYVSKNLATIITLSEDRKSAEFEAKIKGKCEIFAHKNTGVFSLEPEQELDVVHFSTDLIAVLFWVFISGALFFLFKR